MIYVDKQHISRYTVSIVSNGNKLIQINKERTMTYSILEDEIRKALYFMVMVYSKKNLPLSELYRLDMEAMQRIATVDSIIRMTEPMFHGIKECAEMFRAFDRAKTEYDKIHWDIRQQIIEKLDK